VDWLNWDNASVASTHIITKSVLSLITIKSRFILLKSRCSNTTVLRTDCQIFQLWVWFFLWLLKWVLQVNIYESFHRLLIAATWNIKLVVLDWWWYLGALVEKTLAISKGCTRRTSSFDFDIHLGLSIFLILSFLAWRSILISCCSWKWLYLDISVRIILNWIKLQKLSAIATTNAIRAQLVWLFFAIVWLIILQFRQSNIVLVLAKLLAHFILLTSCQSTDG